jgi:hypothetical protein
VDEDSNSTSDGLFAGETLALGAELDPNWRWVINPAGAKHGWLLGSERTACTTNVAGVPSLPCVDGTDRVQSDWLSVWHAVQSVPAMTRSLTAQQQFQATPNQDLVVTV